MTPQRFQRWWEKFFADHPGVEVRTAQGGVELISVDGSIARFTGWYPVSPGEDPRARLLEMPRQLGLILLRRGGYSIGYATDVADAGGGKLRDHKTGTRYVQSRTSAGGWSQQRFARRRENQAEELVRVAADHAVRILGPIMIDGGPSSGLVLGGDEFLTHELLADPRLERLRHLPRREFHDIPDPRFKLLQEILGRSTTVRVAVHNP